MARYLTVDEFVDETPYSPDDFGIYDDTTDDAGNPVTPEEQFRELADRVLSRSEQMVDDMAGTVFVETTTTETTSGSGTDELPLSNLPVVSVTSVTIDGDVVDTANVTVHDTHIELDDSASYDTFPDGSTVDVDYSYGYSDVPAAVEEGVIRLARRALDEVRTDGVESMSESGGISYTFRTSAEIRTEVSRAVQQFRPDEYSRDDGGAFGAWVV